jgi:hypothetical protein
VAGEPFSIYVREQYTIASAIMLKRYVEGQSSSASLLQHDAVSDPFSAYVLEQYVVDKPSAIMLEHFMTRRPLGETGELWNVHTGG